MGAGGRSWGGERGSAWTPGPRFVHREQMLQPRPHWPRPACAACAPSIPLHVSGSWVKGRWAPPRPDPQEGVQSRSRSLRGPRSHSARLSLAGWAQPAAQSIALVTGWDVGKRWGWVYFGGSINRCLLKPQGTSLKASSSSSFLHLLLYRNWWCLNLSCLEGWRVGGRGGHSTTVCHVTFEVEGSCG